MRAASRQSTIWNSLARLWAIGLAAAFAPDAPAAAEQQVVYTDVVAAYEAGRTDDARALAAAHLARFGQTMNDPKGPFDVESGARSTLGLIRTVLSIENRLAPEERLGAEPALRAALERGLLEAHANAAPLRARSEPMRTYLDREFGTAAAQWIRAREAQVSRSELDATFESFRTELEGRGYEDVDAIIRGRASP